jgi:hypothetical protein
MHVHSYIEKWGYMYCRNVDNTSRIHRMQAPKSRIKICNYIVTYEGLAWLITKGSGFSNWHYWPFFIIIVKYNSSHVELFLNGVTWEFSMKNFSLRWMTSVWRINFWKSKSESKLCYDRWSVGQSVFE